MDEVYIEYMFNEFWKIYPRKVGKAICRAKFHALTGDGLKVTIEGQKLVLKAKPEAVVQAAKAFRYLSIETEERFIPLPKTWLNQGRYEDIDGDLLVESAERYDWIQRKLADRNKHTLHVVGGP